MDISFTTARLAKLCNSESKLRGKYGPIQARRIQLRLSELQAAECLEDLRSLPACRCHELTANMKGKIAVDVVHPQRLIFQPNHDPVPSRPDGGLDWKKVTKVVVEDIIDYH